MQRSSDTSREDDFDKTLKQFEEYRSDVLEEKASLDKQDMTAYEAAFVLHLMVGYEVLYRKLFALKKDQDLSQIEKQYQHDESSFEDFSQRCRDEISFSFWELSHEIINIDMDDAPDVELFKGLLDEYKGLCDLMLKKEYRVVSSSDELQKIKQQMDEVDSSAKILGEWYGCDVPEVENDNGYEVLEELKECRSSLIEHFKQMGSMKEMTAYSAATTLNLIANYESSHEKLLMLDKEQDLSQIEKQYQRDALSFEDINKRCRNKISQTFWELSGGLINDLGHSEELSDMKVFDELLIVYEDLCGFMQKKEYGITNSSEDLQKIQQRMHEVDSCVETFRESHGHGATNRRP